MNIGLQPQYPTMWWIDGILVGIILTGFLIEWLLSKSQKRKVEKDQRQYKQDYKQWEEEKEANAVAIREGKDVEYWYKPEPRFNMYPSSKEQAPAGLIVSLLAGIVLFCTGLATIIMCVPFNSKYFNYYVETGKISKVVAAVTYGDDSTTNDFIVALAGDPKRYEIGDARVRTLEGQQVSMVCHAGWNNQAADTWVCDLRDYEGSTRGQ